VTFDDWSAGEAEQQRVVQQRNVHDYEPGEFWKRELPCLLAVLQSLEAPPQTVVIDGYVWLDGNARPGLGARLYEALGRTTGVVGVAKTAFRGSDYAARVHRAGSRRPLFVTAAGIAPEDAAAGVGRMSGAYRIPDLLKRVDQLSRRREAT
jgi:deoxyribonuclease V